MNETALIAVTLGGGLGTFLLGMRHLSDGLQAASGEGLRRFMSMATGKRLAGVATGVVSTVIVQSSSIVTVILVGFVSSGLMRLPEALNVLIGANIGTTFTVWLMAFAPSPETLGLALFCVGSLLYFPLRRSRLRYVGQAFVGLGLVFLGMAFMKDGVAPIRTSPTLSATLAGLRAGSLAQVALVALVACLFTAIVQSSAASILIFMTLAAQGLVPFEAAVAALFGANVGTTATGWLASLGGSAAARRVALAHTLTNAAGSLVCLPLVLPVFVPLCQRLFPDWLAHPMAPIAVADTLFSVLRGALVYPCANALTRALERLVPEREEEKPHLSALGAHGKMSPVISILEAGAEVSFMAESAQDMMAALRRVLRGEDNGGDAERHIVKREGILDRVQSEVTAFLGEVMMTRLSPGAAEEARNLLRLADELESISDEPPAILQALRRIRAHGDAAPNGADRAALLDIHDRAATMAAFTRTDLRRFTRLPAWRERSAELKRRILAARQTQLLRVGDGGANAVAMLATLDILNAYDRIRAYAMNVAEVCAGGKGV